MDDPPLLEIPERGYVYVTTQEGLEEAIDELRGGPVLGVDIEGDSFFSYEESCCLVQVTGLDTRDFIIDPLEIDDMSSLGPLLADRDMVKIFHGADYDVVSLKRDFGFEIRNLFDTMITAQATGHERFSLGDLVHRYFGTKLNKRYQRHDWSSRPLLDAHLNYARNDTHFLPALRDLLMEQAEAADRTEMLQEEFELLEEREWTGRPFSPDDCMRVKGAGKLDDEARRVLRAVFSKREGIAEGKNRPPFKVWGNDALMLLAKGKPKSQAELREVLGEKHHIARRFAREVTEAVRDGLADESPPPETFRNVTRTSPEVPPFTREDEALMAHLKRWRNSYAAGEQLAPAMIVNNAVLKEVSALRPASLADLDKIEEMRRWQKREIGELLVELVVAWIEKNPKTKRRRRRNRRRKSEGEAEIKPA
jgi:ribonuclease D